MAKTFLSKSPSETKKIGRDLAKKIKKDGPKNKARILALEGDLGGGKTTFLQGFAKGLGIEEKILSPTFVIMKRFGNFYHFDCYRIQKPEELLDLGFKEIISNPQNIIAIEWADRIKKLLPKDSILVRFKVIGKNKRRVVLAESAL